MQRCAAAAVVILGLFNGCSGAPSGDDAVRLKKLSPAFVTNDTAWALFDRSVSTGYVPGEDPLRVRLDRPSAVWGIKVFGSAPYALSVEASDGSTIGLAAVDLSQLGPRWHTFSADTLVSTNELLLSFRPMGPAAPVPEIELWSAGEQSTDFDDARVAFAAESNEDTVSPGNCVSFRVPLERGPTLFRRAYLSYEATGVLRAFALARSINDAAQQGGDRWLPDQTLRTVNEEIDPAVLRLGANTVRLCAPSSATQDVSIAKLRIVADLDVGSALIGASIGSDERDASALTDGDESTTVGISAGERVALALERSIVPDALFVAGPEIASADCVTRDGRVLGLTTKPRANTAGTVVSLDSGGTACSEIGVTFASTVSLPALDLIGSGLERVDWPRVVTTSPREHFGTFAWVGGFVARPARMSGAVRVELEGARTDGFSGDFGAILTRPAIGDGPWPVTVSASLPDGTTRAQQLVLGANSQEQLSAASSTSTTATAASRSLAGRFGAEGDSVVVRAATAAKTTIRLGTSVGVDVPPGALRRSTNITVRHLGESVLPPLDPGMINVTAPKGRGYEFLPHGQTFRRAAEVVLPYDRALIPDELTPQDVHTYFYDPVDKHWKRLERVAIDVGAQTTRSATDHFTIMINAVLTVPKNPTPLSFDPTMLASIAAASPAANIDLIEPPVANPLGDARLSFPIRVPSGRGAHTPSPVVTYSSAADTSWLGLGWDLDLSTIEIDTRFGVPRYDGNDRYVFDGASLVPTTEVEGPRCQDGSVGLRFHSRVEGAFAHILRCGSSLPRFEVRDRDGTLYIYGDDPARDPTPPPNASLIDPAMPGHVARWHLSRVIDVHGNVSQYRYSVEDFTTAEPGRQIYPESITYTAGNARSPAFKIRFELDDGSRIDKRISGRMGFKTVLARLLRTIHVEYRGQIVRDYVFQYDRGAFGKSRLLRLSVYGVGGCAAGSNAFQAPSCPVSKFLGQHNFEYYDEPNAFAAPVAIPVDDNPAQLLPLHMGATSSTSGGLFLSGQISEDLGVSLGGTIQTGSRDDITGLFDLDGDNLPDQVYQDASGVSVLYNRADPGVPITSRSLFADDANRALINLPRIGHEGHGSWGVNAALQFGVSLSGSYSSSTSESKARLVDLDGDGYTDYLAGTPRLASPCPAGMCFSDADFGALSSIDPRQDPILNGIAAELSQRLILGDPVVQWTAPRSGRVVVTGSAKRLEFGGADGVTVELYSGDALLEGLTLAPIATGAAQFTATQLDLSAGDTLYLRVKTGADVPTSTSGEPLDVVDAGLHVEYVTLCSGVFGCAPVVQPLAAEPTGAPLYSFDSRADFRIAGAPTFFVAPANGTVAFAGMLHKAATAADVRACLQVLPAPIAGVVPALDIPCDANIPEARNVSGTLAFAASAQTTHPMTLSTSVAAGELVMLRVESDFSVDPAAIRLDASAPGQPLFAYSEICLPGPSTEICTTDPATIGTVRLPARSTNDFGPYIALAPYTATPVVAPVSGPVMLDPIQLPQQVLFAIRSDRQGLIHQLDCRIAPCGQVSIPPFFVAAGESISFEILVPSPIFQLSNAITGTIGGTSFAARIGRTTLFRPPGPASPFVGGYHGWRAGLWNEAQAFTPTLLLADYAQLETLSQARLVEVLRSAILPLPSFGHDPTTGNVPAWLGAGSSAFVAANRLNAAYLGLLADGGSAADGGGLFQGGYSRLSGTRSKAINLASNIVSVESLFGVDFGIGAGSSDTTTTTDVLDLTGDGVADVLAGTTLTVGAISPSRTGLAQLSAFGPSDGFRKRHGIDYSISLGETVTPVTTSSGRTTMMGKGGDAPGLSLGFGVNTGIAIQRSGTTDDLADVNGDGLPDLIRRRNGSDIEVRLNFGNRFGAWETFGHVDTSLRSENFTIDGFQAAERKTDWIPLVGDIVDTTSNALQHDTTITQHTTSSFDVLVAHRSRTTTLSATRTTRQMGDLNGDGLLDMLVKKNGEPLVVQFNLGSSFGPPERWDTPDWPVALSPIFESRVGQLALTGPDVLAGTGLQTSTSTSYSLGIPIPSTPILVGGSYTTGTATDTFELALVDLDGDSAPDHVLRRRSGGGVTFYMKRNLATGKANLLKSVRRPLGALVTLDYARTRNTVEDPQSRWVMSSVKVDDAIDLGADYASPDIVTVFRYEHGVYQRHEKELYGFGKVTAFRADGTSIEQTFSNDPTQYALRGRLLHQIKRDPKEQLLERQDISYAVLDVVDASNNLVTPDPSCTDYLHPLLAREPAPCRPTFAVVTADQDTWFEDGFTSKTRTRTTLASDYDRFGNELVSRDAGDDAIATDDLVAVATYSNNTARWVLGRPTSLVIHSGTASGPMLRWRKGDYNDLGDATAIHVYTGSQFATTKLGYDAFGNVNHVETPPNEHGDPQTLDIQFDADVGTYPVAIENGFHERSTATYDVRFGVPTSETAPSGATVSRTFDDFGRLETVRGPYDTTLPGIEISYFLDEPKPRAVTTTRTSAPPDYIRPPGSLAPALTTVTVVDGLGRAIEVRKTAFVDGAAGMTSSGLVKRDFIGLVVQAYQPFFTMGPGEGFALPAQPPLSITTSYDAHDRPIALRHPDGAVEATSYAIEPAPIPGSPLLLATIAIAANGNKRESYTDLLGRVRAFVEHPTAPDSSTTATAVSRYEYLPTGELATIVDAEGSTTTLAYDLRGLRTSLDNPDTGLVEERFDAMGNRVALVEPNHRANSVEVRFEYDRDRPRRIDYPSKPDVTFAYGDAGLSTGRLVRVEDESGSQVHSYGAQGELVRTVRTVSGTRPLVFDTRFTLDSLGRQLAIQYPDGVTVTSSYDKAGMLERVEGEGIGWARVYASDIRYDVYENRTQLRAGNGALTTWTFDPQRIRLAAVDTVLPGSKSQQVQALRYRYDPSSNPIEIHNALPDLTGGSGKLPGESTVKFVYDGVDRLARAEGSAQLSAQKRTTYVQAHTYSASHNLLTKARTHLISEPSLVPTAPVATNFASPYLYESGRPHLPSQIGDLAITYDPSGNPLTRQTINTGAIQKLTWDDDGRLASFQGGGINQTNIYDADGLRVRRKSTQSETVFASMYFDVENGTQAVRHVFAGELRVASELNKFVGGENPTAPDKRGTVYFFHGDQIGSTTVLTTDDGTVHQSLEYFPDGETWIDRGPQKPANKYLFSGKPFDPDTGFYDFGQRFYDPRTSLWLGTDPAFADSPDGAIASPIRASAIAYGGHNPHRFIDPDGRDFWDIVKNTGRFLRGAGERIVHRVRHPIETVKAAGRAGKALVQTSAEGFAKTTIMVVGDEEQKEYVRRDQPLDRFRDRLEVYAQTTSTAQAVGDGGGLFGDMLLGRCVSRSVSSISSDGTIAGGGGAAGGAGTRFIVSSRGTVVERAVADKWGKGSFGNVVDSIEYHFAKHGAGRSLNQYTNDALRFFQQNKGQAQWGKWNAKWEPSYRIKIGDQGGYFTADGRVLTYWD